MSAVDSNTATVCSNTRKTGGCLLGKKGKREEEAEIRNWTVNQMLKVRQLFLPMVDELKL